MFPIVINKTSFHAHETNALPLTGYNSTLKRIRWLFINKNAYFLILGTINAPPFHSILLLCVRCLSVKQNIKDFFCSRGHFIEAQTFAFAILIVLFESLNITSLV